jgi:hypothetical protein
MTLAVQARLVCVLLLCGCRTAHDVATSSYQTAAAPVDSVRQDAPSNTIITTTTTTQGNRVATSVQQVDGPPPPRSTPRPERDLPKPESKPAPADHKPEVAAPSRPPASQLDFPTAKPVEGKPGYVYSPFDPGKYVDVSGYTPGSKVKDPYSGKIFLVP